MKHSRERKKLWMQKRLIAAGMACVLLVMTAGCASVSFGTEARLFNETVDAFFQAVDDRDKEAVYNLFSPYARENSLTDLEEDIDRLFDFYPGPTQKCERDGTMAAASYSSHHGARSAECGEWFAVICNDVTYYCDFNLVYRNDGDEDCIGVESVSVVSEKAVCSEDFRFSSQPGLHIVEDAPGDYETRRIRGYPEVYVSMDRVLTEEEILEFLEKDASFKSFRENFGEPNSETSRYTNYAYELEEEDGEKRYAVLSVYNLTEDGKATEVYEKGTITKVVVENEVDKAYLYVLWEQE